MRELSETSRITGAQGSLYGSYKRDAWYADLLGVYGQNSYETTRRIAFGEVARTAKAKYAGDSLTGYAEAGRIFKMLRP
jgi:uncharacterized protein with beta-barrel porin domain